MVNAIANGGQWCLVTVRNGWLQRIGNSNQQLYSLGFLGESAWINPFKLFVEKVLQVATQTCSTCVATNHPQWNVTSHLPGEGVQLAWEQAASGRRRSSGPSLHGCTALALHSLGCRRRSPSKRSGHQSQPWEQENLSVSDQRVDADPRNQHSLSIQRLVESLVWTKTWLSLQMGLCLKMSNHQPLLGFDQHMKVSTLDVLPKEYFKRFFEWFRGSSQVSWHWLIKLFIKMVDR